MTPPAKPRPRSAAIFARAQEIFPGGVNSPVRAFRSVGGTPLIIDHASGSRIFDVDGNEYLDFIGSWGPLILGHAHPAVVRAIADQAARGTTFGMTTELEVELAACIQRAMPAMEKLRFVSSGTEAAMSAVRLARAATARNYIVKFNGCYHGHADSFLSEAGSGLATLGIPASPGVPPAIAALTLNIPYNDSRAVEQVFAAHAGEIAAVIVEPIAANMGVVAPEGGFLSDLREITRRAGALLIIDEVITGFRVARGGAQGLLSIEPDLTLLGKIIGGGLPVAAYGGRRDLMDLIAPSGTVYQAGTLSGNPLAMRAGIETLRVVEAPGFYEALAEKSAHFVAGLRRMLAERKYPAQLSAFGSLLTLFFSPERVRDFETAKRADAKRYAAFFWEMMNHGILLAPSQFEAAFVSAAHSIQDLDRTTDACRESLAAVFRN
ncbi:MAG: glutamate-1-semialdehyde 2,1-aminomutase [Acidipila sp.]|nr:glutamate-1-semialdehyde 2,1-aminomutase [Acidipila sp.]